MNFVSLKRNKFSAQCVNLSYHKSLWTRNISQNFFIIGWYKGTICLKLSLDTEEETLKDMFKDRDEFEIFSWLMYLNFRQVWVRSNIFMNLVKDANSNFLLPTMHNFSHIKDLEKELIKSINQDLNPT